MGKFKKMLAGMLSAAMVMSTMTVSAFAADTSKMPTIDTTKKGSITINKYEGEKGDTSKPLAGVEFTIYKIAELEQSTNPVELKYKSLIGDNVQITGETKYNDISSAVDNAIKNNTLSKVAVETTALNAAQDKATATFSNLDLGVYLVKETNAPSQVVNKTANFLVSVPMTNTTGDDWIYDIEANPKNAAVYAGVTLTKKGTTIKTDGTTVETELKNVTFMLQNYNGTKWTDVGSYTTNDKGMINVEDLAPGKYRFIETSLGGSDDNKGYILDGKGYEFTVTIEGKIKVGNDDAKDQVNIEAVNEKPELEKTVKNKDGSYDNDTDASIGSTVSWKVEATVPSNVDELNTYKITDKMSDALTWKSAADAKLTIATNSSVSLENGTDYTLTTPEDNKKGGTWTIEFTADGKTKLAENRVKVITVTFDTVLNENAKIGNAGNLNDAELEYSNAIYPTIDPENPNNGKKPGIDKITDEAIVYTFKMNVLKVDGKDTAKKLENVEFDLYKYNGNKANPTEEDLKNTADSEKIGSYKTNENGEINVSGLENGTYYLVETKTNDGYNLLKEPVKVTINIKYTTKADTTIVKDENGNVVSTTTVSTKTFVGGNDNSGTFTITVKNYTGFQLPTTGGMGTILFSVAGVLVMIAAAFILLKGRKKEA